jgi:hypothetical protein
MTLDLQLLLGNDIKGISNNKNGQNGFPEKF